MTFIAMLGRVNGCWSQAGIENKKRFPPVLSLPRSQLNMHMALSWPAPQVQSGIGDQFPRRVIDGAIPG